MMPNKKLIIYDINMEIVINGAEPISQTKKYEKSEFNIDENMFVPSNIKNWSKTVLDTIDMHCEDDLDYENTKMNTEQGNIKIQISDIPPPNPRFVDDLYGDDNMIRSRTSRICHLTSRIQLGQSEQVIICSFIGGNNTYKKDEDKTEKLIELDDQEEWWTCKKCDKNIMESVYSEGKYHKGEYHKKYCNSTKDKHKHKLIPDYTTKRVKDKCCFRCGEKGHYIVDCKYPNI